MSFKKHYLSKIRSYEELEINVNKRLIRGYISVAEIWVILCSLIRGTQENRYCIIDTLPFFSPVASTPSLGLHNLGWMWKRPPFSFFSLIPALAHKVRSTCHPCFPSHKGQVETRLVRPYQQ